MQVDRKQTKNEYFNSSKNYNFFVICTMYWLQYIFDELIPYKQTLFPKAQS